MQFLHFVPPKRVDVALQPAEGGVSYRRVDTVARCLKCGRHHPPEGILRIVSSPDVRDPQSEGRVDIRGASLPNVVPFGPGGGFEQQPQPWLVLAGQLQVLDELPVDVERVFQTDALAARDVGDREIFVIAGADAEGEKEVRLASSVWREHQLEVRGCAAHALEVPPGKTVNPRLDADRVARQYVRGLRQFRRGLALSSQHGP